MYRKALARFALAALLLAALPAQSASVDLATLPLTSGVASTVAPNIYFILDDSTSMDSDYMPDDVGDNDDRNCFKNHGYNTIYYNPATVYEAPKNSDGTSFLDANTVFTSAKTNGYNAASGTTDLSETSTQNISESVSVNLGNNPFSDLERQPQRHRHPQRSRPRERHPGHFQRRAGTQRSNHQQRHAERQLHDQQRHRQHVSHHGRPTTRTVTATSAAPTSWRPSPGRLGRGGRLRLVRVPGGPERATLDLLRGWQLRLALAGERRRTAQLHQLVQLLPHSPADDEDGHRPRLCRCRRQLPRGVLGDQLYGQRRSLDAVPQVRALRRRAQGDVVLAALWRRLRVWHLLHAVARCALEGRADLRRQGARRRRRSGAVLVPEELHDPDHGRLLEYEPGDRDLRRQARRQRHRRRRPGRRGRHRSTVLRIRPVSELARRHRNVLLQVGPAPGRYARRPQRRKRARRRFAEQRTRQRRGLGHLAAHDDVHAGPGCQRHPGI